jgi:hypothetical protein
MELRDHEFFRASGWTANDQQARKRTDCHPDTVLMEWRPLRTRPPWMHAIELPPGKEVERFHS